MTDGYIRIRGAREHNLKAVDLDLPRNRLIVITGLSGSGKSSLAFDTLYAEGQRRYVESLSAYARQFLDQLEKPEVESIDGLSPAIAIEQRTAGSNPRSTVATQTEIYDYLRVLFARIGQPHCPECARPIARQSAQEIVAQVLALPAGTELQILAPLVRGRKGEYQDLFTQAKREGFLRVRVDGRLHELEAPPTLNKRHAHTIEMVVDRLRLEPDIKTRLADSVEAALKTGKGIVVISRKGQETIFSELYACPDCGISLEELSPRVFSFNSPYGACPGCDGLGTKMEIDPDLIVPDPDKSIRDGALVPWRRGGMQSMFYFRWIVRDAARRYGFSLEEPFRRLPARHQRLVLRGSGDGAFEGVIPNLERRFRSTESEYVKEEIARYMSVLPCPACQGARLKSGSLAVTIGGQSIHQLTRLSIERAQQFFETLALTAQQQHIAHQALQEVRKRLTFLLDVGLGYLTLDRPSGTLSGGEAQRIRLATQVGAGLVGVLYVLDEPSIGLHQRDNERLLATLERLRDLGNTLVVVEHDEATIRRADYIVDLGPGAGKHGGDVVAAGTLEEVLRSPRSLTAAFLNGTQRIAVPQHRRKASRDNAIVIRKAAEHNLKGIDVRIPLGCLTCVTGVSGSGKSTLVDETLYRALAQRLYRAHDKPGTHETITGVERIDQVIVIDQSPIGRTPRSNPATYTGVFSPIRDLFAQTPEARLRGYKPGRFSFNVKGGRCEACQGDGIKRIEMHFLPDVYVHCELCKGRRFNEQTLQVAYKGRSIADVLEMTVEEALALFANVPAIAHKLQTLADVGLGYIEVGQSATTLSGGEAQRIKLSKELSRRATGRTLYLLDEPTTGLHFADIEKLLGVLHALVEQGNTVLVIEHNLDVIKTADHLIDLGPEGGEAGGRIVAEGTPEQVAAVATSHTGRWLRPLLALVISVLLGLAMPAEAAPAPTNEQLYEAAQQSFNEGRYVEAQETLARLLSRRHSGPVGEQARMLLLQSHVYLGRLDEAQALLEQARRDAGAEPRDDLRFWEAEILRKRGRQTEARAAYQQLLTDLPQSPIAPLARYSLGLTWYEEGAFAEALQAFQQLLQEARTTDVEQDARFMLGLTHYRLGRYQETVRYLRALLAEAPDFRQAAAAHYYLGEAYYYINEWAAAQQAYAAALAGDPGGPLAPYASYGLGWALYQLQRYDAARTALERFLQARPDDPLADSARYAAAQCARQRHDLAAAQQHFDAILTRPGSADTPNPWLDEAWLGQGDLLAMQDRRPEAIALYTDAVGRLQDRGQRSAVHRRLAELLTQEQRLEEAQRAWRLAAEDADDPAQQRWAWLQVGNTAQMRRQWTEAEAAYARAAEGQEVSLYATYLAYQRARLLRAQGRVSEAIAALQAFLAGQPRAAQADAAVVELAQAYAEVGEFEAAATQWQALITQYPQSALVPQAYLSWGTLLMDRQRWAEAAERFHALVRFFPNHPLAQQALLLRAQALQLAGRTAEAERAVRAYVERPLPPEQTIPLWIWLGQAAARQQRGPEAQRAWQTVVDRWPDHPGAAQAMHELAQAAREAGRWPEAQARWQRIVERFPQHPWAVQARLALADGALQRQDLAGAREWLAPVLAPGAAGAEDRIAVGDFWRRHGVWTEARAAYAPRPMDTPEQAARLWWLSGACEEEAGNLEAAVAAYQTLDQRYPDSPWAAQGRLAWGQVLERQERWDEAHQLYQRVILQYPEEAGYTRERLEALNTRR